MSKTFHYGGQAVIEGVMIRGQKSLSMAVRRPCGEIALITKPVSPAYSGKKRQIPLIRGVVILVEMLVLGIEALFQSANISMEEEEKELSSHILWVTFIASLGFAVALFFLAPLFLTDLIDSHFDSSVVSNIIEGFIRIGIFALYLGVINLMPDIRRVFAYHGAEHKAVNAYENGAALEVGAVSKYSTAHARCGTSFLLAVLVISIIVFTLVGHPALWLRILSRIVLIPVIAALGYEVNRFVATYANYRMVRPLLTPGLALQSITTREPDDTQLEVAITALRGAIKADESEEIHEVGEQALPPPPDASTIEKPDF